jgi:probable addiction module antidote protein
MPTRSYQSELLKQLRDPNEAAEYLNACYRDSEEVFFVGLRNVVEAGGGIRALSKLTALNRENLYRVLSEKGNPKFSSLAAILEAVGIDIHFTPRPKRKRAA